MNFITNNNKNFYQEIDNLFNELIKTETFELNKLINIKQNIINIYENDITYKGDDILENLECKNFKLNKEGNLIML